MRLISATIFATLLSTPNGSLAAPARAGVCHRLVAACHHDAVLVEPSGDKQLDEAALAIFAEGRYPEPCQSSGRWVGTYVYQPRALTPTGEQPSCNALPEGPRDVLRRPMSARWNVPLTK
jgi:hypothetical protein